jgi:class 3 adenylate cyclase
VAEEVLGLLREWGWDGAQDKLQARVQATADPKERGLLQLLLGWQAAEHSQHDEANRHFQEAAGLAELRDWALVGEAFVALTRHGASDALKLLAQVSSAEQIDQVLRGAVAFARGIVYYRQGQHAQALEEVYGAAKLFGTEHFGFGRVLDSLAMVYAALNDYPTAMALYQRALGVKEQHDDLPGMALTHGQLGRLALDWGDLEMAEQEFRKDLELVKRLGDGGGEAQMYNHLGQVYLARGWAAQALGYLDESVRCAQAGQWPTRQAYAQKDRALAYLALNRQAEALKDAEEAERCFQEVGFAEGAFHAQRVRAQVLAARGQYVVAEPLLTQAAAYFARTSASAQAARAYQELARVRVLRGAKTVAAEAYLSALDHAEQSRRDTLVSELEQELVAVEPLEHYRWVLRRVRGQGIHSDAVLMEAATPEEATVLFLDLFGFTAWSKTQLPQVVRRTLNQLFAALAPALDRQHIVVNQHLGDGFMALVRGEGHARRAVAGGLAMLETMREFNRPRRLLGWSELQARVGVCSGPMVFGNVGTPRKIDYTAVGEAVNKAARTQNEALPGEAVCVAEETRRQMGDGFEVRDAAGRPVTLKGLGEARVWDVVGLREG